MSITIGKIRAAAQGVKDAIGGDPGKARAVLKAEGVLTPTGKLTARYSTNDQAMAEFLASATGGRTRIRITLPKRILAKGIAMKGFRRRGAKSAKPE